MNLHATPAVSFTSLSRSLWRNRQLILQMTRRADIGRYKGSVMGLLWSFLNPVFMLAVYTFVFSVVFKARWGVDENESKTQFAIILFVGMIVHSLFAEVLNRAPSLLPESVHNILLLDSFTVIFFAWTRLLWLEIARNDSANVL